MAEQNVKASCKSFSHISLKATDGVPWKNMQMDHPSARQSCFVGWGAAGEGKDR